MESQSRYSSDIFHKYDENDENDKNVRIVFRATRLVTDDRGNSFKETYKDAKYFYPHEIDNFNLKLNDCVTDKEIVKNLVGYLFPDKSFEYKTENYKLFPPNWGPVTHEYITFIPIAVWFIPLYWQT